MGPTITKLWTIITIYAYFASKQVDKVGLFVAEKVDEDFVLHLRKGDADGGPTKTIYFFFLIFSSFPPFYPAETITPFLRIILQKQLKDGVP